MLPETAWISPMASRFHFGGRVRRTAPTALLTGFAGARKSAPVEASFAEWASSALSPEAARLLARLAGASFSYHHDPGGLSAKFVWDRLRWMMLPPAVHRVLGGWNALVDRLVQRSRDLGVEIECGHTVDELPEPPVIVALELRDAAKLLGREFSWPSAGGVALDIGLEHRRGDPGTILDLDHGLFIQGQHASAAPAGHRLYQAHCAFKPSQSADDARARIEDVFDHAFPHWRQRVAFRRQMNVAGRTGAVDYPGQSWRDRPGIEQAQGVFLVGDSVAAEGLLSEVSFSSAREGARRAIGVGERT